MVKMHLIQYCRYKNVRYAMTEKEKNKNENHDTDMDVGHAIKEEAEILAIKYWKKPYNELSEFNRSECLRMAEDMVLGL